mmetsp:Transcript_906/g.1945  ORF Transcript_906/g.1945 Transcript_906/m.1945 type:complete len:408 (+) Transcript_906:177-1400(+)
MRHRSAISSPSSKQRNINDDDVIDKPSSDSLDVSASKSRMRRVTASLIIFGLASTILWTILVSPFNPYDQKYDQVNHIPATDMTNGAKTNGAVTTATPSTYNPTLLSPNSNEDTKVWFASAANKMRFELPTDMDWIRRYKGIAGSNRDAPFYMRPVIEIEERGTQGGCAGVLEVLHWLTNQVNDNKGCLMVAYGELIHLHREKDFVNSETMQFFDDDIDLWASLDSVSQIALLEPVLFESFGWTARPIVTEREVFHPFGWPLLRAAVEYDRYVVLVQVTSVCGLTATETTGKLFSSEPTIDVYPIVTIPAKEERNSIFKAWLKLLFRGNVFNNGETLNKVMDLWQGNQFSESLFFPRKDVIFNSVGTSHALQLQFPNQPIRLMECLYGNWTVPSSEHAGEALDCLRG